MSYREAVRFTGLVVGLAFFAVGFFHLMPGISDMASFGLATTGVAIQIASQFIFKARHAV